MFLIIQDIEEFLYDQLSGYDLEIKRINKSNPILASTKINNKLVLITFEIKKGHLEVTRIDHFNFETEELDFLIGQKIDLHSWHSCLLDIKMQAFNLKSFTENTKHAVLKDHLGYYEEAMSYFTKLKTSVSEFGSSFSKDFDNKELTNLVSYISRDLFLYEFEFDNLKERDKYVLHQSICKDVIERLQNIDAIVNHLIDQ